MQKLKRMFGVLAIVGALTGCGDGSSPSSQLTSSSQFTPRTYSGSMSGDSTGTFTYTVNDSDGNISGTVTVAGKNMTLKGFESKSNNIVVIDINDSTYSGRMSGTKSTSGSSGTWYLQGGPTLLEGTFTGSL